tara:strand:+ start:673 stop:957 length:285 start_codon:yes stop_codon:yes gene_type:complete
MAYKMKGFGGFKSSPAKQKKKQEYEGAETMGSEQLRNKFGVEGLESSTDYYIKRGDQNEPMILGEVDLEEGNVTGVPGSKGGKLTRKDDKQKNK